MPKLNTVLFLTLRTFSATGGIEKVCRIVGKAIYESDILQPTIFSLYDRENACDTQYFPRKIFKGFAQQKARFISSAFKEGKAKNIIILSHINLLPVGYLIKFFSKRTKLVLFAHGVEVWKRLPRWKRHMLKKCDRILAVSKFTKENLELNNKLGNEKCIVLNNCLDPFLSEKLKNPERSILYNKYEFTHDNFILITVTRIVSDEKYKGHDKVIEAIACIIKEYPNIKYLIVGKYDLQEKARLDNVIDRYNLNKAVVFAGFVANEELPDHFNLADVFIMPSYGEGFGIAFIEAMYYKLPVIAGNKDGSTDALCDGQFGLLVDPLDVNEISSAIKKIIINKNKFIPPHNLLMEKFGYAGYKQRLQNAIQNN